MLPPTDEEWEDEPEVGECLDPVETRCWFEDPVRRVEETEDDEDAPISVVDAGDSPSSDRTKSVPSITKPIPFPALYL